MADMGWARSGVQAAEKEACGEARGTRVVAESAKPFMR